MNRKFLPLMLFLLFAIPYDNLVTARPDDSDKPINIKANSAEIDDINGISVYRGDVEITQGSMFLTGEKVTIEMTDQKVQKLISEGNLSTFRQTAEDGEVIYAEAEKIVYDVNASEIVLLNNAKLTEADNTLMSNRITLYPDKGTVNAGSSSRDARVNITISPEVVKKEKQ